MSYLSAISKMTEWSRFIFIQHHSNPNLCLNHWCQRQWSWPVLWRPTGPSNTKRDVFFLTGNWNAKVGHEEIPWVIGKFVLEVQNEAGKKVTALSREHTGHSKHPFRIIQEMILHMDITKGQYQNKTDYILCSCRWKSSIQSAKGKPRTDCGSDHQLLIAKFRLKLEKYEKPLGHSGTT